MWKRKAPPVTGVRKTASGTREIAASTAASGDNADDTNKRQMDGGIAITSGNNEGSHSTTCRVERCRTTGDFTAPPAAWGDEEDGDDGEPTVVLPSPTAMTGSLLVSPAGSGAEDAGDSRFDDQFDGGMVITDGVNGVSDGTTYLVKRLRQRR